MTSTNSCLRLAGRLFGLALLLAPATLAQTPAPAPAAPRQSTPGALSSVPQASTPQTRRMAKAMEISPSGPTSMR